MFEPLHHACLVVGIKTRARPEQISTRSPLSSLTADVRRVHGHCNHMSLDTEAPGPGLPGCKFLLRKSRKQVVMLHGFSQGIDCRFQGEKQFNHKSLGIKN